MWALVILLLPIGLTLPQDILNLSLVDAVEHDNYTEAARWLSIGANPNSHFVPESSLQLNQAGKSAVDYALPSYFDRVRSLFALHRVEASAGNRLIFCAVGNRLPDRACSPALIKRLIASGAGVNSRDEFGQTPLMYSVWDLDPETAHTLLDCGADQSVTYGSGWTVKRFALGMKDKELVRLLVTGPNITKTR